MSLPLASLLTPTAFGASNDVLCPWARGEVAAAASMPRWIAEGRLTWRVLRPEEPATFSGLPLAEGRVIIEGLEALEARCGAEPGRRNYLIAASGSTASGAVTKSMYEVGKLKFEEPWCLVSDPTPEVVPGAWPRPRVEVAKPDAPTPAASADSAFHTRSRLLDFLAGGSGESGEAQPEYFTIVVQDPPKLLSSMGELKEPWQPWLIRARPSELVVALPDRAPWASAVAVLDAAHGVGSATVLAMLIAEEGAAPAATDAPAASVRASAEVTGPWDGMVAALPIAVPRYR